MPKANKLADQMIAVVPDADSVEKQPDFHAEMLKLLGDVDNLAKKIEDLKPPPGMHRYGHPDDDAAQARYNEYQLWHRMLIDFRFSITEALKRNFALRP
jgi:hypothetical protein